MRAYHNPFLQGTAENSGYLSGHDMVNIDYILYTCTCIYMHVQ